MASGQPLGGATRAGRVVGPALDKIIKNAAWRKHSALVSACKAALDRLDTLPADAETTNGVSSSPLVGLASGDADLVLLPLCLALESAAPKVVDPALECALKLFSGHLLRAEIEHQTDSQEAVDIASRLMAFICTCGGLGDEAIELSMLRVLVAAVRSPVAVLRGECLAQIVKSCYNVYLGSQSAANQVCAKVVLAQILTIVYARVEADVMEVRVRIMSIADMLDLSDKNLNDSSLVQAAQNFINEAMEGNEEEVVPLRSEKSDTSAETANGESVNGGEEDLGEGLSKTREDGLFLFKSLCKLSMKFSTQENPDDPLLLRGKVLSLELLKMVIDNAGSIWRTNEKACRVLDIDVTKKGNNQRRV